MYLAGTRVGFPQVWVQVQIYLPAQRPVPMSTHTHIYMAGWLKMVIQKNSGQATPPVPTAIHYYTVYISHYSNLYIYSHPIFFHSSFL